MDVSIGMEEKTCYANERKLRLSSGSVQCIKVLPAVDCGDHLIIRNNQPQANGVYTISPQNTFDVYCDFETAGGPWTVIQARVDGSVSFDRVWADYKAGFGDLTGNFWLGNENMHNLLSSGNYSLRVDMEYFDGARYYAEYSTFNVTDEGDKYRLQVGGYTGDAGDSLLDSAGLPFTTIDANNGPNPAGNCADFWRGGWWFNICYMAFLNGKYFNKSKLALEEEFFGIHWLTMRSGLDPLRMVSMKVRKNNAAE